MKLAMFSNSKDEKKKIFDEELNEVLKVRIYRCAVYIRVSTKREEQKSSIENQRELFIQLANEKGWIIVDFYEDVESGTRDTKREALKRLISDAKLKKFDLVLSKEISRLSRNGTLSYTLRDTLLDNKIDIITLDGAIDTTKGNIENFGLFVWMAEQESNRTSRRIKQMFMTEANKGNFTGSNPPYGYRVEDKKLIIRNDDTPQVIKRIYNEYLEGKGFDAIARGLYNDGIPTPAQVAGRKVFSDKWQGSSVRKILTNPHYTGTLVLLRDTKPLVTSKRMLKSQEETIIIEKKHDAIIPLDVFSSVQDKIISRKRIRPQQEIHLFTNTIFCADCGRGMHYKKNSKGYVCGNYNKHGSKACTPHLIREKELENEILNELNLMISNINSEEILNDFENRILQDKKTDIQTLKKYDQQINNLIAEKTSLTRQKARGEIKIIEYQLAIEDINKELCHLQTAKQTLEDTNIESNLQLETSNLKNELEKQLLFTELTPTIFHSMVKRIDVKSDGSALIYYNFSKKHN